MWHGPFVTFVSALRTDWASRSTLWWGCGVKSCLVSFCSLKLNIKYPVKSFAPYLGGCRGRVPSDSLRKFLQEVNLYNLFNIYFLFFDLTVEANFRHSQLMAWTDLTGLELRNNPLANQIIMANPVCADCDMANLDWVFWILEYWCALNDPAFTNRVVESIISVKFASQLGLFERFGMPPFAAGDEQ